MKGLKKVMVCVPTTQRVNIQLVPKLTYWKEKGADVRFVTVPFIDNARNVAVRFFLKSKCDYLFFVDADVIPNEKVIEKFLKSKKDIIGGWYNLTLGPTESGTTEIRPSAFDVYEPNRPLFHSHSIEPNTGLKRVELLSGGLVLIHRKVLEKLAEPWFQIKWNEDEMRSFIGEDIGFCNKATNAGFELWCDTDEKANHVKEIML